MLFMHSGGSCARETFTSKAQPRRFTSWMVLTSMLTQARRTAVGRDPETDTNAAELRAARDTVPAYRTPGHSHALIAWWSISQVSELAESYINAASAYMQHRLSAVVHIKPLQVDDVNSMEARTLATHAENSTQ